MDMLSVSNPDVVVGLSIPSEPELGSTRLARSKRNQKTGEELKTEHRGFQHLLRYGVEGRGRRGGK